MTRIILKITYNFIRQSNLVGGISNSFLFLQDYKAITANHVLNKAQFRPNDAFAKYHFG